MSSFPHLFLFLNDGCNSGAGYQYRHKIETTYNLAMDQRPDLLLEGIEILREAIEKEDGQFATAIHILANSLVRYNAYRKEPATGPFIQEAFRLLRRSVHQ